MKFRDLANFLAVLDKTSSRNEITKILAELFKKSSIDEIDKICYLILGQLAPNYKGIVFDLAESLMLQVIAKAYGQDIEKVKKMYKKAGDLGNVAERLSKSYKGRAFSVTEVYNRLLEMAQDEGLGSQERKIDKMANLLSKLNPLSSRYVSRIPVGKLRLGFSNKTIIDALSYMETGDKSKSGVYEKVYQIIPDIGLFAQKIRKFGIDITAKNTKPAVGMPILPMLAQSMKSPKEMIEKMGLVFVEPKFDGLRVTIHFKRQKTGDFVKAFTRNLNDISEMFPELSGIGRYINAKSVILDSEAVGMDPEMIRLVDFQTTMRRRRKYDIAQKAKDIPLRFQVFDIIVKNGKSLMDISYKERREILANIITPNNLFVIDESVLTHDPEVIIKEYRKKISQGLEGVIVKKADAHYVPGRTGWRWVKMKVEETSHGKLTDTIDCLVMGFTRGKGKRAEFGLGQFLVGVKNGDEFKTLTKVGSGLSDEEFREFRIRLEKFKVKNQPKEYKAEKIYIPDFWIEAKVVVELAGDDLTKSPTHSSGFGLRFPRLVRFRNDKDPDQVTTVSEIKRLFKMQKV